MANKASNHIERCNIGTCEAHNDRTDDYMKHIKPERVYIIQERTHANLHWKADQLEGKDLATYKEELKQLYIDRIHQAPNEKDREVTNKKTGKKRTIAGWSPIREGVVNIKPTTTLEDLQRFSEACSEKFGFKPIRIDVHFDEGHITDEEPDVEDGEKCLLQDGRWVSLNLHAHIIYDWVDHETGKTYKCNEENMAEVQNLAAEILGMERGRKKSETGREHLSREEFIARKLQNRKEELTADIGELEEVKAQKQEEANNAQADLLHRGMGALGEFASDWVSGKNARKNKENDDIRRQNRQLVKERDEATEQARTADERAKARYQRDYQSKMESLKASFDKQVDSAAERKVVANRKELEDYKKQFMKILEEKNRLVEVQSENFHLKARLNARDDCATLAIKLLWNIVAPFFEALRDLALNRKISVWSEFTEKQVTDMKRILQKFSDKPDEQEKIAYWFLREASKKYHFNKVQEQQCEREMKRVLNNEYQIGLCGGYGMK